ncbi:MAG: aminoacyl-tRNA hydrolase [candidate division Zixibacteria bacterium]|nr:aminoacyl-tRNA hydrolase [candidate division Zixibacteria bacterium]
MTMKNALLQPDIKLVAGLGNPGNKYSFTRHNAGFMAIDRFAARHGVEMEQVNPDYELAEFSLKGRKIRLLKPLKFMNNSGLAVARIKKKYDLLPEEILLVSDDVYIPLGKIRIRKSGSDGGHRGLGSVIEEIESRNFPRVRFGIGPSDEGVLLEDFVLQDFRKVEEELLHRSLDKAVKLLDSIIYRGIDSAIGTYTVAKKDEIINS